MSHKQSSQTVQLCFLGLVAAQEAVQSTMPHYCHYCQVTRVIRLIWKLHMELENLDQLREDEKLLLKREITCAMIWLFRHVDISAFLGQLGYVTGFMLEVGQGVQLQWEASEAPFRVQTTGNITLLLVLIKAQNLSLHTPVSILLGTLQGNSRECGLRHKRSQEIQYVFLARGVRNLLLLLQQTGSESLVQTGSHLESYLTGRNRKPEEMVA